MSNNNKTNIVHVHVYRATQVAHQKMDLKCKNNKINLSTPGSARENNNKKKSKQYFTSTNRYSAIAPTDNDDEVFYQAFQLPEHSNTETQPEIQTHMPPPIIVKGVTDFINVRSDLINLIGSDRLSFKSTISNFKIQINNPEAYRAIIHYLKDAEAQYHTYQTQEDKAYRIVIRNLHSSINTIKIKAALKEVEFSVWQIKCTEINKNKPVKFFLPTSNR